MSHPTKYQMSDENKQTIEEYLKDEKIVKDTLSEKTIKNKRHLLWNLAGFLKDKPFIDATEKDLKQFFSETTYKGGGKEPLKVEVVSFYKWLYKTDETPKMLKWVKFKTLTKILEGRPVDYYKKKMVSDDDYNKFIQHNSNDIQMVAYLETLHYSGRRPSDILSSNIGDVKVGDGFIDYTIRRGKTGHKTITIPHQCELLVRWIDNHPMKNDPNKNEIPLFINFNHDKRVYMKRMKVDVPERIFRQTREALGLNKEITPYSFRHTHATKICGTSMPRTHIETMMGWKKGSRMFEVYDHNDEDDLRDYLLGTGKKPEPTIDILKQQKQRIEKEMSEKQQLKGRLETLEHDMKALNSTYGKMMLKPTKLHNEEEFIEFPGCEPAEVIQKYNQFQKDVDWIISRAISRGVPEEEIKKYKSFMNKLLNS